MHSRSLNQSRLLRALLIVCSCLLNASRQTHAADEASKQPPNYAAHAFYYPWYGNVQTDGKQHHWNHSILVRKGPARQYLGGDDIGSNFYPALGCYSANDPAIVEAHMRQLLRARIGVISVSWWGIDSYTDRALPLLFRVAEKQGIQINFHIEPHLTPGGRDARKVRESIVYLLDKYGRSPALYRNARRGNRPMFYIYDSYLTKAQEWATILAPDGADTLRGTKYDSLVIGLWVKQQEEKFMLDGHFDGYYTYFATDGFTYGSTLKNWKALATWARTHDKLFIPCVAPGYVDTRIRPWNGQNTRSRENGAYYDRSFKAALAAQPECIGITSFNEWHEGTQIEPAITKQVKDFQYEDYAPHEPTWYLDRTAYWLAKFETGSVGDVSERPRR